MAVFPLIAFALVAGDARAEEPGSTDPAGEAWGGELDRWVPSIGVFGGFQEQPAEGEVDPGMLDPAAPQCVEQRVDCEIDRRLQPFDRGQDEIRGFRAGLSFELMTPRLVSGAGHARLFVHVDPILAKGFERTVAGTGNPGRMVEGELALDASRSDAMAFSGQGSRVLAKVSPFVLNAGMGVAFTLDLLEQRVRIKPSIEYVRERLTVTGKLNRVVQVAQIPRPGTLSDFRFIQLDARQREAYHALGPGLEIEVDASRIGPFLLSPFAAAHAHHFLGNLDVDLRAQNAFGESVDWRFTRDQWQWEARFGIRLRWVPEDS